MSAQILTSPRLQAWGLASGIVAAVLHLVSYGLYARQVWVGQIDTNIVSWALFSGEFIVLIIYRDFTRDWPKDLLNVVCATCSVLIFGIVLARLGWGDAPIETKILPRDMAIVAMDVLVVAVWALLRERKEFTGLVDGLLQLDIALGFAPLLLSTHADPSGEWWLPWALWSIAYVFQGICVALRWDGRRESTSTPFSNFIWHAIMFYLVFQGSNPF